MLASPLGQEHRKKNKPLHPVLCSRLDPANLYPLLDLVALEYRPDQEDHMVLSVPSVLVVLAAQEDLAALEH